MGLKSISFLGGGYEDILLYLTYCIKELGIKVLIRDRTTERILYSYVPKIPGINPEDEILDISCAHYTSGEKNGEYDVIIDLFGYEGLPLKDTYLIVVTDEQRRHEEALTGSDLKAGDVLIIRNYTGVIKKQYDNFIKRVGFGEIYALPFSERDLRTGYLTQYQKKKGFGGVSNELEEVIKQLFTGIAAEYPLKEIKRAFKKGKRGTNK